MWRHHTQFAALPALTLLMIAQFAVAAEYHNFVEKPFAQLSDRELSDWGEYALKIDAAKWQHGETAHFVIHFQRQGQSIANRCETFYEDLREFFGNRPDRMPGKKSQVFAFARVEDWMPFARLTGMRGIAGITRDNEFFYITTNAEGAFDSKGHVQAHEMTHLVFNRLFVGRPPLWLNEGIAEYFGLLKTANRPDVQRTLAAEPRFPLAELFAAQAYPEADVPRRAFYAEATVVVDFLSYNQERRQLLPKFVEQMIAANDVAAALKLYGYADIDQFSEAYEKYRRVRYR